MAHSLVILEDNKSTRPDTGPYLVVNWLLLILQTVLISSAFGSVPWCETARSLKLLFAVLIKGYRL